MKVYILPMEMVNALRSWFHPKDRHLYLSDSQYIISRQVARETIFSRFSNLPGSVGFWPMGTIQPSTGNVADLSGHGRTLTFNGNPTFNIYGGLVPYIDLDGSGDYLSRADETDLDLTGAETIYAPNVRGITWGGWFWLDTLSGGTIRGLMTKNVTTGNQRGYLLALSSADGFVTTISSNGIATTGIDGPAARTNRWYFVVARFVPQRSVDLYVGDPNAEAPNDWIKTSTTTSIPSANFANTAPFEIGRVNTAAGSVMDGRATFCFLCANALSDDLLEMLFRQSAILFKAF